MNLTARCALASTPPEQLAAAKAAGWDWYRRAGVDSSWLVPVVMGVGVGCGGGVTVCQGQCERPLCFSTAAEYEGGRRTWMLRCLPAKKTLFKICWRSPHRRPNQLSFSWPLIKSSRKESGYWVDVQFTAEETFFFTSPRLPVCPHTGRRTSRRWLECLNSSWKPAGPPESLTGKCKQSFYRQQCLTVNLQEQDQKGGGAAACQVFPQQHNQYTFNHKWLTTRIFCCEYLNDVIVFLCVASQLKLSGLFGSLAVGAEDRCWLTMTVNAVRFKSCSTPCWTHLSFKS